MNHRPASVATEFFNSLLEVLKQLPPVMAGAIADNPPLYAVLAALLRENEQLYNLYVGYDDAPSLNWMLWTVRETPCGRNSALQQRRLSD